MPGVRPRPRAKQQPKLGREARPQLGVRPRAKREPDDRAESAARAPAQGLCQPRVRAATTSDRARSLKSDSSRMAGYQVR
eukprot:7017778-Alexandrium_andersonii.AAC.1